MNAQTVITLLFLIFCGAFGCAPRMLPTLVQRASSIVELPDTAAKGNSAPVPQELSAPAPMSTPVPAVSDRIVIEEDIVTVTLPKTIEAPKKTSAKATRGTDSLKIAPALRADDPGALQKTPGPRADDRLLNLLEKDLDKAVENLKEQRRRLEFSKEVSNHPKVRYFINYFTGRGKPSFEKILSRSGRYMPMIARVMNDEGLPEELAYLALIESAFLTGATSLQGAAGLWQFVPSTARIYGLRIDSWIDERRDPEKSTRAAAAYLKELHSFFGRWYLATAAYNAGQGAIDRAMQKSGAKDFWTLTQKAELSDETRNFVPKFVAAAIIASNPEKYGFTDLRYESPLEYEEVEVHRPLRLGALAEFAESEVSTIRELNPALRGNATPPGNATFTVNVPSGKAELFVTAYAAANERLAGSTQSVTHEVKRGETLTSIARRYGQEVSALMKFNGLTSARLQVGQQLRILLQNLSVSLK